MDDDRFSFGQVGSGTYEILKFKYPENFEQSTG